MTIKPSAAIAISSVALLSAFAACAQALAALPPGFDPVYYADRYPDLKKAFGDNTAALAKHWADHGKQEMRFPSLQGDATKQPYATWKSGCEKGWWGFASTRHIKKQKAAQVTKHCAEGDYKFAAWASSAVYYEPQSAHLRDHMRVGDWLKFGEHLMSASKSSIAALQPDGNFCVDRIDPPGSNPPKIQGANHWCTMPPNAGSGPFWATLHGDGNFCVSRGTGPGDYKGLVSCARSQSAGDGLFFAVLQDDGNFAIYRGTGPSDNKGYVWDRLTQAPAKPANSGQSFLKAGKSAMNTKSRTIEDYKKAKAAGPGL
jgi:hypothetical protein